MRGGEIPRFAGIGAGRQSDAIVVNEPGLGLQAVIYIGSRPGRHTGGRTRSYVRGMLIDDACPNLLPGWAFFAWAVADSSLLEPTASREAVREDTALAATRAALGRALLGWLQRLADEEPQRFSAFVEEHDLRLRSAITQGTEEENLELARVLLPMMPVETTRGVLRLRDVVAAGSRISYAVTIDDFRSIAAFNPDDRLVVNAGHVLEQEMLLLLAQVTPG